MEQHHWLERGITMTRHIWPALAIRNSLVYRLDEELQSKTCSPNVRSRPFRDKCTFKYLRIWGYELTRFDDENGINTGFTWIKKLITEDWIVVIVVVCVGGNHVSEKYPTKWILLVDFSFVHLWECSKWIQLDPAACTSNKANLIFHR